jgi:UDP-N-acetylmuramate-alanine ligase
MGHVQELVRQGFTGMGKRAVADIVKESGSDYERAIVVRKPEASGSNICKEHGAKRVLEPRVVRSRIDKIRKPELPDIAEALQRRGIEQGERKVLYLNVPVDRIFDDFQIH